VRKAVMILLALLAVRLLPRALRREARALELVALLAQLTAAAIANTSKTASTANRTASLEARVGSLEQGVIPNVQSGSTIGTLQRGIFVNVSGGAVITMETQQGSVTLHCGALSNFTSGPQTTFLASLTQCGPQAFAGGDDGNTGASWASGERGYINDAKHSIDAIHNSLINHGFMSS